MGSKKKDKGLSTMLNKNISSSILLLVAILLGLTLSPPSLDPSFVLNLYHYPSGCEDISRILLAHSRTGVLYLIMSVWKGCFIFNSWWNVFLTPLNSNNNPLCCVIWIKHTNFLLVSFLNFLPVLHCLRDFIEQVKQLIVARLSLRWTLLRGGACSFHPTLTL